MSFEDMREDTYAIPEPIARGRETDTTRPNWKWENLANHNPCARSPSRGEEGDVEADEGDHGRDSRMIIVRSLTSGNTNDTNDKLHNDHSGSSDDENLAATETLHGPERDRGRAHIDQSRDEGNEERVADCA